MKSLLKSLIIKGLIAFGVKSGFNARTPKFILLKVIAGCLFLVAGIFALIALHQLLRTHYPAQMTNLFFAGGFAIVALGILLTVAILRARHRQKSPLDTPLRALEELSDNAQVQAKQIAERAGGYVRHHSGSVLLGVAILGLILGRRSARK